MWGIAVKEPAWGHRPQVHPHVQACERRMKGLPVRAQRGWRNMTSAQLVSHQKCEVFSCIVARAFIGETWPDQRPAMSGELLFRLHGRGGSAFHIAGSCGIWLLYPTLAASGLKLSLRNLPVFIRIDHLVVDDKWRRFVLR